MKVISQYISTAFNAGPKAKKDVETILAERFHASCKLLKLTGKEDVGKLNNLLDKCRKTFFSLKHLSGDDLLVVQFPFNNNDHFLTRAPHKVALVHDLNGIREQDARILCREVHALKQFEYVIVHNDRMKDFLISQGVVGNAIFVLELFDYLCEKGADHKSEISMEMPNIVYTGNVEKSPFIRQMHEEDMKFRLLVYGSDDVLENKNISVKGKFPPDTLPAILEGDLGLVWDGAIDEGDQDRGFKNYTRYNNPHKFSCYLAAGLPVICWSKAAIADFVIKSDIGYTINHVYDINTLPLDTYERKKENVRAIGERVRTGYYTKKVFNEILKNVAI